MAKEDKPSMVSQARKVVKPYTLLKLKDQLEDRIAKGPQPLSQSTDRGVQYRAILDTYAQKVRSIGTEAQQKRQRKKDVKRFIKDILAAFRTKLNETLEALNDEIIAKFDSPFMDYTFNWSSAGKIASYPVSLDTKFIEVRMPEYILKYHFGQWGPCYIAQQVTRALKKYIREHVTIDDIVLAYGVKFEHVDQFNYDKRASNIITIAYKLLGPGMSHELKMDIANNIATNTVYHDIRMSTFDHLVQPIKDAWTDRQIEHPNDRSVIEEYTTSSVVLKFADNIAHVLSEIRAKNIIINDSNTVYFCNLPNPYKYSTEERTNILNNIEKEIEDLIIPEDRIYVTLDAMNVHFRIIFHPLPHNP